MTWRACSPGYNRIDLDVEVQGYGKGALSLVLP